MESLMLLKRQILSVRHVELEVGSNVPLMDSLEPRCLVVVKLVSWLFGTNVVCDVAAPSLANLVRVIGRRT